MNKEDKLFRQLSVGHLNTRFDELSDLMKQTDPMSEEFIDLMKESANIVRQLASFEQKYAQDMVDKWVK